MCKEEVNVNGNDTGKILHSGSSCHAGLRAWNVPVT